MKWQGGGTQIIVTSSQEWREGLSGWRLGCDGNGDDGDGWPDLLAESGFKCRFRLNGQRVARLRGSRGGSD